MENVTPSRQTRQRERRGVNGKHTGSQVSTVLENVSNLYEALLGCEAGMTYSELAARLHLAPTTILRYIKAAEGRYIIERTGVLFEGAYRFRFVNERLRKQR